MTCRLFLYGVCVCVCVFVCVCVCVCVYPGSFNGRSEARLDALAKACQEMLELKHVSRVQ